MNETIIMKMLDDSPDVVFVGTKEKAEAMMFRIIMNSEAPFIKKDNDYGIEIVVKETHSEVQGRKSVHVPRDVRYFMQTYVGN
jgi:hypothetical protein